MTSGPAVPDPDDSWALDPEALVGLPVGDDDDATDLVTSLRYWGTWLGSGDAVRVDGTVNLKRRSEAGVMADLMLRAAAALASTGPPPTS